MAAVIDVQNLSKTYLDKRYRKVQALKNVSLTVEEGEAFGFVGPNGAGKSSTIKILVGIVKATSGQVSMFGKPVTEPLARKGMAYVPENPCLYDYLSPLEVLQMGLAMHHVQVDDKTKHCMQWLERFGIAHVANKRIRTFSKGMTQRTALAHALSVRPHLLILDEPLSGLDPLGRRDVVDILEEYTRQGGALFFSSHVLHDVERLADRFGLIHQGEMRAVCSVAEMMARASSVSVVTRGDAAVAGLELAPIRQGVWRTSVESARLWDVLQLLRAAGHMPVEIRPEANLEKMLLELTRHPAV